MRHTTSEEDKAINKFLNVKGRTILFNREDRDLAEYAKSKGWTIIDKLNMTKDSFIKGDIRIWYLSHGMWVSGRKLFLKNKNKSVFVNRRYFKTLKEALDAE
jgi:hypothetical protein